MIYRDISIYIHSIYIYYTYIYSIQKLLYIYINIYKYSHVFFNMQGCTIQQLTKSMDIAGQVQRLRAAKLATVPTLMAHETLGAEIPGGFAQKDLMYPLVN